MSSQCGVSPQQIIRFGGQSACNASATGRAPTKTPPPGEGGGGGGWGARGAHTQAPTHTRVLSHTYEGISLNGILSILRCPFLNGTSVKGKDTYVNNVFHTGLSSPAALGLFTVLKMLVDLNLI